MPKYPSAVVRIKGASGYSQSRPHNDDKLEKESAAAYDERTWRSKMTTVRSDQTPSGRSVAIPAHGMMQAIAAGAKNLNQKIPGQRNATWTKHFVGGIAIPENIPLNIDPDTVEGVQYYCHADGRRGSGTRVYRRFPEIEPEWEATFEVWILDKLIHEAIFREVMEAAGLLVGIGRFRPENGGLYGRFTVESIQWNDAREFRPRTRAY